MGDCLHVGAGRCSRECVCKSVCMCNRSLNRMSIFASPCLQVQRPRGSVDRCRKHHKQWAVTTQRHAIIIRTQQRATDAAEGIRACVDTWLSGKTLYTSSLLLTHTHSQHIYMLSFSMPVLAPGLIHDDSAVTSVVIDVVNREIPISVDVCGYC